MRRTALLIIITAMMVGVSIGQGITTERDGYVSRYASKAPIEVATVIEDDRMRRVVRLTSFEQIPSLIQQRALSVGRVRLPEGNGYAAGSGTYVGDRLVITAKHVIRGGDLRRATVDFGGGPISVVAGVSNKYADQTVLELGGDPGVPAVPIAARPAQIGDVVYGIGYGNGSQFGVWAGRIAKHSSTFPGRLNNTEYLGTSAALNGDSGGATLNAAGELVGTLWGSSTETRQFLNRTGLFGRLRQQCQPGTICPPPSPYQPSYGTPGMNPGQSTVTYPSGVPMGPPSGIAGNATMPVPAPAASSVPGPAPVPPARPQPTVPVATPTQAIALIDVDDLAGRVAGDPRFRGNPGPPGTTGSAGPRGEQGPSGPAGRDGRARGPSADQMRDAVEQIVRQLKADPEFIASVTGPKGDVGPPGSAGPPGPAGPAGQRGPAGRDGTDGSDASIESIDMEELTRRVAERIGGNLVVRLNAVGDKVEVNR